MADQGALRDEDAWTQHEVEERLGMRLNALDSAIKAKTISSEALRLQIGEDVIRRYEVGRMNEELRKMIASHLEYAIGVSDHLGIENKRKWIDPETLELHWLGEEEDIERLKNIGEPNRPQEGTASREGAEGVRTDVDTDTDTDDYDEPLPRKRRRTDTKDYKRLDRDIARKILERLRSMKNRTDAWGDLNTYLIHESTPTHCGVQSHCNNLEYSLFEHLDYVLAPSGNLSFSGSVDYLIRVILVVGGLLPSASWHMRDYDKEALFEKSEELGSGAKDAFKTLDSIGSLLDRESRFLAIATEGPIMRLKTLDCVIQQRELHQSIKAFLGGDMNAL